MKRLGLLMVLTVVCIIVALGQTISYTTAAATYSQDFNTLPSTGTATFTGLAIRDLSAAPVSATGMTGWYFAKNTGSGANDLFTIETGSGNSGALKDYGVAGTNPVTDRALGGLGSGTFAPKFGALITNNTGGTLNKFTITFTGEQWRAGSANVNTLTFRYAVGASTINDASVAVTALNFASPILTGGGVALDGNASANRITGITATVSGLTWAAGTILAIRWDKVDDPSSDNGIAIDDLSFSADVQPPTNYYYDGSGDLHDVTNWGLNTDGSGTQPADFTADIQIFNVRNTSNVTTTGAWAVSGSGSKAVIGDGTNAITFTVANGFAMTGSTEVAANATVVLQDATLPGFASIAASSTVNYAQSPGPVAVSNSAGYGNLNLTGGTKTIPSGNTTVVGNVVVDGVTGFTGAGTLVLGGNLTLQNSTTMTTGMSLTCNGSSGQALRGNGTDIALFKLTHGNSSGITLSTTGGSSNLLITGTSGGNLALGANTITTGTNFVSVTGAAGTTSRTSGYIVGNFKKNFASVPLLLNFEVGTVSGYSPVTVNATAGTGDFTVGAYQTPHPSATGANVLQRYWKLTPSGVTTADLTFQYLAEDVVGTEASYLLSKWDSAEWTFPSATYDNGLHTAAITGVTSFSDWTLGEQSYVPVQVSSFSARASRLNVSAVWHTASEVQNTGFDVERRAVGGAWTKVAFVAGAGTSNEGHDYSFTDVNVAPGRYAYRLKQIDKDGSFHYYGNAEVEIGLAAKALTLSDGFPNPFNPTTKIEFTLAENSPTTLKVYNVIGQEVATLFSGVAEAGRIYQTNFNASALPSGIYFARLESGSAKMMKKLMLVK